METKLFLYIFLHLLSSTYSQPNWIKSDEHFALIPDESSPCLRTCSQDAPPMECRYKFIVETYQTLSRACYDCPNNQTDCSRPHCVAAEGNKRTIVTVNRSIPGPAIQVCKGDRIKVQVENHMATEDTTIHWHGIPQKETPYMDGVPYITQCPIAGGNSFQYDFTAAPIGTHMWHSHRGNQRGDGIYGSLVIRQPKEEDPQGDLYDYDLPEHVMVIADWTQSPVHNLYVGMVNNGDRVALTTILVNGVGYFYNSTYKAGVPAPRFHVEKGYRHRFRLINAEFMMCPIEVSVDNHTMDVISLDGYDIKPITVSSFTIYAGERFDFVINTDQEIGHYWIRFRGQMSCTRSKAHQAAILSYKGAEKDGFPPGEPTYEFRREDGLTLNSVNEDMLKNNSVSVAELRGIQPNDETLKEIPDKKFYLHSDSYNISNANYFDPDYYDFNQSNPRFSSRTFQINHISLGLQPFPLLSQRDEITPNMFCNESTVRNKNCTKEYCECTHVLQVPLDEVVELILVDVGKMGNANHPYHLHGSSFRVIGMEKLGPSVELSTIKDMDEKGLLKRNLSHAPWKDTVTVPDGGYTIVRFHASNPGYWIIHCHVDYHATMGMALIFKVGEHEDMVPVPKDFPQCRNWKST